MAMTDLSAARLPFDQQIEFFRDKVNLPTRSWTDIYLQEHDHSFVVAGAMKDALLADLRKAIDTVIAQGQTLAWFRTQFDEIIDRHGWRYNGGRGWRTRVIYETNLYTSYAAGRYAQMKQLAKRRPYWRYRHSDWVTYPRPIHQSWDGLVIRNDDPWWETHYPPNGWGCKCYVETLSETELKRSGKMKPDEPPPTEYDTKTIGIRGPNPRTVTVPKGIDPGFEYTPGRSVLEATTPRPMNALPPSPPPIDDPPPPTPRPVPDELSDIDMTAAPNAVLVKLDAIDKPRLIEPPGGGQLIVGPEMFTAAQTETTSILPWLILIALADPDEAWAYIAGYEGTAEVRRRLIRALEIEGSRLWGVMDWGKSGWSAFLDMGDDPPRSGTNTWKRNDG